MAKGSSTARLKKPGATVDVDALLGNKGKAERDSAYAKFDKYKEGGGNNSTMAGYLSKSTGGDAPPKVMDHDDFERAIEKGDFQEVGYRTVSTLEQAKQFAFGKESYDGKGVHGDGHYIAMYGEDIILSHDEILLGSKRYAWRKNGYPTTSSGYTMRLGIKKNAKIGTEDEIVKYMEANYSKSKRYTENKENIALAAKKMGLDGYRAGNHSYKVDGYFVLLNRNVAVVDRVALRDYYKGDDDIPHETFTLKK